MLSSCRLWCPPRPWSRLRNGDRGRRGGTFLHRVSAHAVACPANHAGGARLLAALLPPDSPAPLHRLVPPVATAAAAAAGVAAAATAGAGVAGGAGRTICSLVGRVHTAAALERSEGLRRQAVGALEHRIGDMLQDWDLRVAGDLFPSRGNGSGADGGGGGGGNSEGAGGGGDGDGDGDDDKKEALDSGGWRPSLAANPVLAVTALEVVNVPAVVLSLCHSASPMLQRRVLELARRYICDIHGTEVNSFVSRFALLKVGPGWDSVCCIYVDGVACVFVCVCGGERARPVAVYNAQNDAHAGSRIQTCTNLILSIYVIYLHASGSSSCNTASHI